MIADINCNRHGKLVCAKCKIEFYEGQGIHLRKIDEKLRQVFLCDMCNELYRVYNKFGRDELVQKWQLETN